MNFTWYTYSCIQYVGLPSPSNSLDDGSPQARLYLANTSRQNLETIVEAIRHLEGDHLFSDEPAQDVPLALTNKQTAITSSKTSTTPGASPAARLKHWEQLPPQLPPPLQRSSQIRISRIFHFSTESQIRHLKFEIHVSVPCVPESSTSKIRSDRLTIYLSSKLNIEVSKMRSKFDLDS
ncbi:hypothetical protein APICC_09333 [Apis cerana cerana]|uniref:Uncharacterized protein n=1 Tax=Apis cerana cerana TaxID=94128 RepID=A0A2A3EFM5_APICC|nr:hypothetical protein APICC_09333 [Apis cerana cerana]